MSKTSEDVLIIYESEAEQWAWYLHSLLLGSIPEAGMCCYDIATVTSRQDDFLHLSGYKCKLLILSRGLLEGLCQERRFFLSRVLQPEGRVVVLLCGVENLEPLLELVPLRGEECLQISSEQDAQEYCTAVAEIVHRGELTSAADVRRAQEPAPDRERWDGGLRAKTTFLLLPCRVPCENPGQVFLLLREVVASENPEVEFNGSKQSVRAEAAKWNESTLCVPAPDFPAGSVGVTLYCGGVVLGKARLHYYSTMGEISRLLQQAADPVNFMCQALQVSSTEQVDHMLASCLMQKMPTGGFQGLQSDQIHAGDTRTEDIPTLLHFAAEHGLRDLASVLLQCPGAPQALRTADRLGHTPLALAHARGHSHLHVLLQESLAMITGEGCNDDTSVYELMGRAGNLQVTDSHKELQPAALGDHGEQGEEEEDPYAHFGVTCEKNDRVLTACGCVAIANRPPAPTPRPETFPTKKKSMPFIAQVFQKKMSQADSETLYSLPSKQTRVRDSISSTYDTFVPSQPPGLDELIRLQEQVKGGSLSVDEALERFSDWQRLQRGTDTAQQDKLRQLRADIVSSKVDNDNVYDKISIVHHTPAMLTAEYKKGSQPAESDFYSKPLKGQHPNFFRKADKQ
ncbi:B-cell scaffold protein with ankyrin repeats [Electrophorus electricus]|uniref:B-cell scaffold protein with ankyrin repeats n=1 Tax=Electrophorus electricus TaxID=8005 RepID=UPI0015CF948C|nr:B-cell scaffold protein with ankyrin repeats [Electrophorus electricus]